MAVKAKRCPLCGGKPRYVHYAVPRTVCPDAWELTETGLEPMITYKRIVIARFPCALGWISVKDRMPAETHSIFWPWYGRKEWRNVMWREQSDKVLVTVTFKDGTRLVTTGETHDGEWHTSISKTLNPIVTHWMQLSEPPEEG